MEAEKKPSVDRNRKWNTAKVAGEKIDLGALKFNSKFSVTIKASEMPVDMIQKAVLLADEAMQKSSDDAFDVMTDNSIYNFTVKGGNGEDVSLEKYKGKVLIIVNVASQCGLTNSNYTQLKELLDTYRERGLEVAAFPCNQFGGQEPDCEINIQKFVQEKFKFEPDLYQKIKVNGDDADPLFKYLKKEKGGTLIDAIKWNFTKFLVDRNGRVVKRYGPTTEPKDMVKDIEELL